MTPPATHQFATDIRTGQRCIQQGLKDEATRPASRRLSSMTPTWTRSWKRLRLREASRPVDGSREHRRLTRMRRSPGEEEADGSRTRIEEVEGQLTNKTDGVGARIEPLAKELPGLAAQVAGDRAQLWCRLGGRTRKMTAMGLLDGIKTACGCKSAGAPCVSGTGSEGA